MKTIKALRKEKYRFSDTHWVHEHAVAIETLKDVLELIDEMKAKYPSSCLGLLELKAKLKGEKET